ncbi:MAG: hypothetical protein IPJ77_07850 [Planctomycetes bacterium]|nr:hypothetical protein [Planctomycetota bacterium]
MIALLLAAWFPRVALPSPLAGGAVDRPPTRVEALADAFEDAARRLDSDSASERARAELDLGRALGPEHEARVRALLADGSFERALRVRSALAVAPRGLDLAVRIALDGASSAPASAGAGSGARDVRALARDAIEERIARWTPGWERAPSPRGRIIGALLGKAGELFTLDARTASGRVDRALAALARGTRSLPPIVLAPGSVTTGAVSSSGARAGANVLRGSADALLSQLARAHGLSVAGFGFDDDLEDRAARCIVLGLSEDDARSGLEFVRDACLAAAGASASSERSDAARVVGACGWPDGVAWLEARWRASASATARDLVWLDGLIAAADRGALAPCWRSAEEQAWCWRYVADPALEPAPTLRAERVAGIARALALAGPRDAEGGDARARAALADDAGGLANWARLVACEGWARAPGVASAERTELALRASEWGRDARPAASALLHQALRALAAARGADADAFVIERPEALFEWASRTGRADGLGALLADARAAPPERWDDPAALPQGWPAPLVREACAWSACSSRPDAAFARHALALVAPQAAAERRGATEARGAQGARLAELRRGVELLRSLARGSERERVRAALASVATAGGAGATEAAQLIAALGFDAGTDAVLVEPPSGLLHALALGERAARGDERALVVLVSALADATALPFAEHGLDWAVESLRARRDDDGERELVRRVRSATQEGTASLRARFRADAWPVASSPPPTDLDDLAREAPAELR